MANPIKVTLRRIRIDRQGYTSDGRYFGIGAPLFEAEIDGPGVELYSEPFRAIDRPAALHMVRSNKVRLLSPGSFIGQSFPTVPGRARGRAHRVVGETLHFGLTHGGSGAVRTTLRKGDLAYLDTFSGLVPVRIVGVEQGGHGNVIGEGRILVRMTATRGAYKIGQLERATASKVVPRSHVIQKRYSQSILTDYEIR